MPKFTFKAPDGKTYDVNGPEGATEAEAFGILQQQLKDTPPESRSVGAELGRQAGLTARIVAKAVAAPGEMLGSAVGLDTSGAVDRLMKKVGIPEPEKAIERVVGA